MRASMAFLAGAGTVLAAIGVGVGGGITVANIMSPHSQKQEATKLERRLSSEGQASNNGNAPAPAAQPASTPSAPAALPQTSAQDEAKPAGVAAKSPSATPETAKQNPTPNDANAKAHEADLKQSSEKRKPEPRRRWVDRQSPQDRSQQSGDRQQWQWGGESREDRRSGKDWKRRDYVDRDRNNRDRDLIERRDDFDRDRPMRIEFPRFNLFGPD